MAGRPRGLGGAAGRLLVLLPALHLSCPASAAEFHWIVKEDVSAPDGYPRSVIAVMDTRYLETTPAGGDPYNDRTIYHAPQQIPGPELRVRRGDRVVVTVENRLPSVEISIHWHGLHMHNQAWMDGTAHVTSCSIPAMGGKGVYNFTVDQEPGTFWWHSHVNTQYADGLFGAFVIEPAEGEADVVQETVPYTDEQVLTIQDWLHETTPDISARYMSREGAFSQSIGAEVLPFLPDYPWPSSHVLLNGRGQTDCQMRTWADCDKIRLYGWAYWFNRSDVPKPLTFVNGLPTNTYGQCMPERPPLMGQCNPSARPASLHCTEGGATRFRIINTGFSMPLRIWFDRHTFTVVARDGLPTKPTGPHRALVITPGQRVDIVLACDQNPHWRYKVFAMVALREFYPGATAINFEAFSYAVLGYNGDAGYGNTTASGVRIWLPAWCPRCEATPTMEPEVAPQDFTMAGLTQGCDIGCNYRDRIYASWRINSQDYVPFAMEARTPPLPSSGRSTARPADERIVLSVGGGGNWWNNLSDAESHFGLKFEWWSVNSGNNFTNSHAPLYTPQEPLMLGMLLGRSLQELYDTTDATRMPFVQRLRYDSESPVTYEVVLINWEGQQHPWHLHGHSVQLVEQGWLDPEALWEKQLYNTSRVDVERTLKGLRPLSEAVPVLAEVDTFTTAPHSYVVFRLTADNPGAWMMHCHMDFHLEAGMGMLWSVEKDGKYVLPDPPEYFRVCTRDSTYGNLKQLREAAATATKLVASEGLLREAQQEIEALRRDKYTYLYILVTLGACLSTAALAVLLFCLGKAASSASKAARKRGALAAVPGEYGYAEGLEGSRVSYVSVR